MRTSVPVKHATRNKFSKMKRLTDATLYAVQDVVTKVLVVRTNRSISICSKRMNIPFTPLVASRVFASRERS